MRMNYFVKLSLILGDDNGMDNTIINYLRHNVDPAILVASICLWALIFPNYTGIHFNGEFKSLSPIERKLVRIVHCLCCYVWW